jgi:hypothetical protein
MIEIRALFHEAFPGPARKLTQTIRNSVSIAPGGYLQAGGRLT